MQIRFPSWFLLAFYFHLNVLLQILLSALPTFALPVFCPFFSQFFIRYLSHFVSFIPFFSSFSRRTTRSEIPREIPSRLLDHVVSLSFPNPSQKTAFLVLLFSSSPFLVRPRFFLLVSSVVSSIASSFCPVLFGFSDLFLRAEKRSPTLLKFRSLPNSLSSFSTWFSFQLTVIFRHFPFSDVF